jgi:hypothetical protein
MEVVTDQKILGLNWEIEVVELQPGCDLEELLAAQREPTVAHRVLV